MTEEIDLFENYEMQSPELQDITSRYGEAEVTERDPYEVCKEFLAEVEAIGYTFEYGLDGIPYDLRPAS